MPSLPRGSNNQSSPRSTRSTRCSYQSRSYCEQLLQHDEHRLNHHPNLVPSISRTPNSPSQAKPSPGLSSLVNKFEALDAPSLQLNTYSLQPAHLKLSGSSSRRRRAAARSSQKRKLSTIFSPRSLVGTRDDGITDTDYFSTQENALAASVARIPCRKIGAEGQKQSQPAHNAGNLSLCRRNQIPIPISSAIKETLVAVPPEQEGSVGRKRLTSIKDRIKFYDGNLTGNNTTAKPSFASPSSTSIPRRRIIYTNPSYSTKSSKSLIEGALTTTVNPATPTKPIYCSSTPRNQNPVFGEHISNPFLLRTTKSKCITGDVSPITFSELSIQNHQSVSNKDGASTRGQSPVRIDPSINREKKTLSPLKTQIPISTRGKSLLVPGDGNVDRKTRGKISDKIEALYRAKSQEMDQEIVQEAFQDHNRPRSLRSPARPNVPETPATGIKATVANEQKVSDLKMMFEGGSSTLTPIYHISSSKTSEKAERQNEEPSSLQAAHLNALGNSLISPRTAPYTKEIPLLTKLVSPDPPPQTSEKNKLPRTKSSKIVDKIKLFEAIPKGKEKVEIQAKESNRNLFETASKSIIKGRKRMFESYSRDRGRRLKGKDVQTIVNRFQKGIAAMERQSGSPISPPDRARSFTTHSDEDFEPVYHIQKEMVVKEVECVLEEPKPLHLGEMQRLILLCKENGGSMMDKERNGTTSL